MTTSIRKLTDYDFKEQFYFVRSRMSDYYGLFAKIASWSVPVLDSSIPTACVSFNELGQNIDFRFNGDFWQTLSDYDKQFVIAHECLHVILNHGYRGLKCEHKMVANVAMDIAVNHMLVREFKFDREKLSIGKDSCWIDTVFTDPDKEVPPDNKNFEYYYLLLMEEIKKNAGKGIKLDGIIKLDDHESMGTFGINELEEIINKISKDDGSLLPKIEPEMTGKGVVGEPLTMGTMYYKFRVKKVIKRKWSTLLLKKNVKGDINYDEQWVVKNRRFAFLSPNLMLPSETEVEPKNDKIEVFLFMDVSGSCYNLKERIVDAATSLDKKLFKTRIFARSVKVAEVFMNNRNEYDFNINGLGDSDDFRCMENFIQSQIKSGKIKQYPNAVFHITDGVDCSGELMKIEKPERWHWFLVHEECKDWIPSGCHIHSLRDFE